MNLPSFAVKYLRKLLNYPLGGLSITPEEAKEGLRLLGTKKKSEKKKASGRAARAGKTVKLAALKLTKDQIRAAVRERADGRCEAYLYRIGQWPHGGALDWDHWEGGSGRRIPSQSVANTWTLCAGCHIDRTHNYPDAKHWNETFRSHCEFFSYPFTPHVEHKPLSRRGTA